MIKRLSDAIFYRWVWFSCAAVRRRLGQKVSRLDQLGFALLSNNCIAGQLYEMAGLEKRTPTAGLFFRNRAFAKFLEAQTRGASNEWSTLQAASLSIDPELGCPVWERGGGDSIVFLHYPTTEAAAAKWNSRFPRLGQRLPIVIATLRDGIREEDLDRLRQSYPSMIVLQPSRGRIDNDGLDRHFLNRVDRFLGDILPPAETSDRHPA